MKVVVFGAGRIAHIALDLFAAGGIDVAALTCDSEHVPPQGGPEGREVVALGDVAARFPPASHDAFVAVGYHRLNAFRADRSAALRAMGYRLVDCISPAAAIARSAMLAGNCMVLPGASIETGVRLDEGSVVCGNVVIGHHSQVESYAWIAAGALIGGGSTIGARSFLGLGATVGHEVVLGADCFLGANSSVTRSAPAGSVFIVADTAASRLNSRQFMAITKMR